MKARHLFSATAIALVAAGSAFGNEVTEFRIPASTLTRAQVTADIGRNAEQFAAKETFGSFARREVTSTQARADVLSVARTASRNNPDYAGS